MNDGILARALGLPRTSYGPFRYVEAVPWLMLATAFRIIYVTTPYAVPAFLIANIAIFLAFLLVTRRVIHLADGRTRLGDLTLAEQVSLALRILARIVLLMLGAMILASLLGSSYVAAEIMYGFDAIAFDGTSVRSKVVAGILAALILLMVLQRDKGSQYGCRRRSRSCCYAGSISCPELPPWSCSLYSSVE